MLGIALFLGLTITPVIAVLIINEFPYEGEVGRKPWCIQIAARIAVSIATVFAVTSEDLSQILEIKTSAIVCILCLVIIVCSIVDWYISNNDNLFSKEAKGRQAGKKRLYFFLTLGTNLICATFAGLLLGPGLDKENKNPILAFLPAASEKWYLIIGGAMLLAITLWNYIIIPTVERNSDEKPAKKDSGSMEILWTFCKNKKKSLGWTSWAIVCTTAYFIFSLWLFFTNSDEAVRSIFFASGLTAAFAFSPLVVALFCRVNFSDIDKNKIAVIGVLGPVISFAYTLCSPDKSQLATLTVGWAIPLVVLTCDAMFKRDERAGTPVDTTDLFQSRFEKPEGTGSGEPTTNHQ